jgi:hypothetical protein
MLYRDAMRRYSNAQTATTSAIGAGVITGLMHHTVSCNGTDTDFGPAQLVSLGFALIAAHLAAL